MQFIELLIDTLPPEAIEDPIDNLSDMVPDDATENEAPKMHVLPTDVEEINTAWLVTLRPLPITREDESDAVAKPVMAPPMVNWDPIYPPPIADRGLRVINGPVMDVADPTNKDPPELIDCPVHRLSRTETDFPEYE